MSYFKVESSVEVESLVEPYFNVGHIISTIATSAPEGWLLCNGAEHSKTGQYANLYAKIGIRYGETNGANGVGTSHFRLPDLVGKHLMSFSIGAVASGGSSSHNHTINANATAANAAVNHYHAVAQAGFGGANTYHSHSGGDSYVGPNGSNPVNANKTGTGGNGYGAGGAHVHDGYSYGNTNADNGVSYHNVASLGINSHTAGNHSHTSASAISGTASNTVYAVPSYTVNFMIKV
jgi:hypothetical protein